MKKEWVVLERKWNLCPTQDGLELVTPERNVVLGLSDPEDNRDRIASILFGRRRIPQGPENKIVRQMIQTLEAQGILKRQEEKPTNSHSVSKLEQLVWKLRSAFVGSQGPIRIVYHLDPSKSSFSSSLYAVTAKYTVNGKAEEGSAGGTDEDPLIAELKAIMEALERWASGVIPEAELLKSTARKIGVNALNPQEVVAYTRKQYAHKLFPLKPFSTERKYHWKSVMTFPGRQTQYLPLECLYYPVPPKLTRFPYTFANSSGVAAGFSFKEALMRSIYEVIERDAFMLTWINRLSMPKIQIETLPEKERLRIHKLEELGYRIHLVNLTRDLVPVVLAIAVHDTKKPALVLGAASNFNFLTAMSKAISEVEYILYWALRYPDDVRTFEDPRKVMDVLDHMALYASQRYLSKAGFLWEGPEIPCPDDTLISKKHELEKLLQTLESNGKQLIVADLTPPSLREYGVWVIRSIPLGLVPISFGYEMEPLGMKRIREVVGKGDGWQGKPFTHPFA